MVGGHHREHARSPVRAVGRWDGLAIGAAATLACLALGQSSEFIDSSGYLVFSYRGVNGNVNHINFTPLLIGWTRLLAPLDLGHLVAARSLLAVCAGVAVVFLHAAARQLGAGRARSAAAAGITATLPAVVFTGSVVGPYAVLGACASIALFCLAWALRRDAPGRVGRGAAVVSGCVAGYGATVHATGNVLPFVLFAVAVSLRRGLAPAEGWRRGLMVGAAACVGAVGFTVVYGWVAPLAGWPTRPGSSAAVVMDLAGFAVTERLDAAPITLWKEWVVAFAPASLLFVLSLRSRSRFRWFGGCLVVFVLGYVTFTFLLVQGGDANGAYLLPVGLLAALAIALSSGRAVWWLTIVLGAVTAVWYVGTNDRSDRAAAYVAGLEAVVGDQEPYLLLGVGVDVEVLFGTRSEAKPWFFVPELASQPGEVVASVLPQLDALIAAERAAGKVPLLTADARRWITRVATFPGADQGPPNGGMVLQAHLERTYTLAPVRAEGFVAEALELR